MNKLFYGDNLDVLRGESVDLIYLDPPFNSNANYNVLFKSKSEKAIVEVKGGGTGVKDVGRLAQVMEREKAPPGVLVTAEMPISAMIKDAAAVGRFEDEWDRTYPKLQILTLAEMFQGKKPDIPFVDPSSIKRAKREDDSERRQGSLI